MKQLLPILPLRSRLRLAYVVVGVALFVAGVSIAVVPAHAATGINDTINFQGKLVDTNGLNVADSSYSVVFSLYTISSGGVAVWTETQSVSTTDGLFQVELGAITDLPGSVDFNTDNIYLGIKVGADAEMTPRIRFAAVPYAFNAQKVAGLTVTDTNGTLTIPNGSTIQFGNSFTTSGSNALTLTTTGTTNITLPTTGTLLTNTASSNQTLTSTQTSGTVLGLTDSTGLSGNVTGMAVTLSGSGAFDQTGLSFNLSGASGTNTNDIVGSGGTWRVSRGGALTVASCSGCGGGSNWTLDSVNGVLRPNNNSADLLVGGTSSSSAVFKVSARGTTPTASVSARTSSAALLVDNTVGDLFTASSSGLNRFVIKNNGNVGIGVANPGNKLQVLGGNIDSFDGGTQGSLLSSTGGIELAQTANGAFIDFKSSTGEDYDARIEAYGNGLALRTGGSAVQRHLFDANGLVGFNTINPAATFDVRGASGTLPITSISGNTSSAALIVDNAGTGAAFTASSSGLTRFVVQSNGNVSIPGLTSCDTIDTDVNGILICGADSGGSSTNYLRLNNGAFSLVNDTADFLIGSNATGSAKFAFGGMNSQAPMATFSADLMFEAVANSTHNDNTNWTRVSNATAGTIAASGTTQIASISAMTSYNGNIYAGTSKPTGSAEVYRYDMNSTNWTKVSNATAGTIAASGTSQIASISAMTVFDGRMYIGTSKMNEAEIYRYEGGTNWTKVSAVAAGTISTGSTSGIDGVTSMAVYNGRIYAGTSDGARAEIYRYDGGNVWTRVSTTTAGTIVTTNSVGVQAISTMAVRNGILYAGTKKVNDADVVRYEGGTTFLQMNGGTTSSSYTANGTAVTNFDDVTAMTVYNGNLVVALRNDNPVGFELLMLNGGVSGAAGDSWSRLNQTAGQMVSGGTAAIDEVSALTVHNGILYAATRKKDSAEIYRYIGGDQRWVKVSNNTAGTIAPSGGTSGIDAITALTPNNGDLYAGTHEILRAEVYRISNVNINRSYGLKFHAEPSIVGEQGTAHTTASMYYLASASANLGSASGNSGAFVFSHGIQTRNGSYDVAEDYPTRDDSLEAGDVVSIDPNERGFVKKSAHAYDATVLGIYSENPALRLSQEDSKISGAQAIPVALAGRVPVKVSTENGVIKPGDYLAASSKPGVAMKADKSGVVLGQAMGGFDDKGVGKVLAYIKSTSYSGSTADAFESIDMGAKDSSKDVLAALSTQQKSDIKSEVVTDRVIAGLELISPKITADVIFAKKIEADEFVLTAEGWQKLLASGGLDCIETTVASNTSRMDLLESLFASQSAKPVQNLAQASESSSMKGNTLELTDLSIAGLATVSGNLRVKSNTLIEGVLSVVDTFTASNVIVNRMATFFGDVIFHGDIVFRGRPMFNSDTAGTAVIKKGSDRVEVTFAKEYEENPVVSATLVFGQITKTPNQSDQAFEEVQNDIERKLLDEETRYVVTRRTTKGFTVLLKKPAEQDLTFSWTALTTEKQSITEGSKPASVPNTDSPKQEVRIEPAVRASEDKKAEQASEEGGENHVND